MTPVMLIIILGFGGQSTTELIPFPNSESCREHVAVVASALSVASSGIAVPIVLCVERDNKNVAKKYPGE